MNPGTFYLYEYENDRRTRNVGFMRISRHYRSCILQIHARGIPTGNGAPLELWSFFRDKDGLLISSRLAVVHCFGHSISTRLPVSETHFPQGRPLSQIDGFLLLPEKKPSIFWMASSSFFDVSVRNIKKGDAVMETPGTSAKDNEEQSCEMPCEEDPHEEVSDEKVSDEKVSGEEPTGKEPAPETSASETQCSKSSCASPGSAKKISRSELSQLPRKFWPLANNSFLLHGYHNYGHLLLIRENERLWLGVPGTYTPQEARAADLFGFPRFTRSYAAFPELAPEERSEEDDFGHWCRCVGNTCAP